MLDRRMRGLERLHTKYIFSVRSRVCISGLLVLILSLSFFLIIFYLAIFFVVVLNLIHRLNVHVCIYSVSV